LPPSHTQITTQELFLLEAWVAENPGSRLFVRLGRAYLELGRPVDAAQALRRGLMVMPEDIEARHLLALALREMGDRAGALAESLTAARAIAEQADVFKLLGEVLKDEGRGQEAAWAAEVARELALTPAPASGEARPPAPASPAGPVPGTPPAGPDTATLAEIYAAQGLNQQAATIYRRLAALNPGDAALAARLAELEGRAAPAQAPSPAAAMPASSPDVWAEDPAVSPPPSPAQAGPVVARLAALRRAALNQTRGGKA
jgi:tetratricopeptide (TPR) repeat protein